MVRVAAGLPGALYSDSRLTYIVILLRPKENGDRPLTGTGPVCSGGRGCRRDQPEVVVVAVLGGMISFHAVMKRAISSSVPTDTRR